MRIFLTGATGFIGSVIVTELIANGHQVLGLTRSDTGAQSLTAAGAEPHRGDLTDLASLGAGAAQSEGVIHTAFDHDFSNFAANCEKDKHAIKALAAALAGTNRPLIITSGTAIGSAAPGHPATEDVFNADSPIPRIATEIAANAALQSGINVSIVRLPQVHDPVKQGLITPAIDLAREKRLSAYINDGQNRWPAVHVTDAARLYRLAIEKQEPGARYHAVAEQGVPMRAIAEAIAQGLNIPVASLTPEQAQAHFGWLAMFAAHDMPASSAQTQKHLNWHPTGPTLLADLEAMNYNA